MFAINPMKAIMILFTKKQYRGPWSNNWDYAQNLLQWLYVAAVRSIVSYNVILQWLRTV